MKLQKHGIHWLGNIILLVIFLGLIYYIESKILDGLVTFNDDTDLGEWLKFFQTVAFSGCGAALLGVIFWYVWGTFLVYPENDQKRAQIINPFIWWIVFLSLCVIVLVCMIITKAKDYVWLVHLFYAFNILGYFYLTTALFSPVSIKYTPPGAKYLRKFWDRS